jgi:NitT/TauT family transport system ATP-binding protein
MNAPIQGASLIAKDLLKSFPETGKVVDQVSLSIQSGEFVALLGPSGCGKSTFLRLAAGLESPSSGELTIDSYGSSHFRSFVFQESTLLPWRTVLKNVMLPLELRGLPIVEAEELAITELKRVGLGHTLKQFPFQLSGGMKMRVSLARALVTKPQLLLMDEPFSALDENARHALQDELRGIWESRPLTILFVTHSVSEAVFLSNRVVVLSKRPARVVLDHSVGLGDRTPKLRTSPVFLEEIKKIYDGVPFSESPL